MTYREYCDNKENHVKKIERHGGVVYIIRNIDDFVATGFSGRRGKPDFKYRFNSLEKMTAHIDGFFAKLKSKEEKKLAEKNATHSLKIGDILYSSWGYDQTNIDFYQVTKVISDKSVKIRRIASKIIDSNWQAMSEKVVADPNNFLEEEMTKRVRKDNIIKIESYAWAYQWDGSHKHATYTH